ncbi:MAG TPA: response regulator transcription factor [Actinomycetota bacterium]|nr:response regulator transcription factor [Actinomycetota bacterium]
MQLFLVEDERQFAHLLARRLNDAGYETAVAFTGTEGLERASNRAWDLLILDVMLPEMDGVTLTKVLRERGCQVPILMLTARDAVEDRVKGLRSGADDYLVKPFAFAELLARVEALGRRTGRSSRLSFGQAEMDLASHRVSVSGTPVELTPKEFDLLEALLRGAGRVLTRMEIKEYVWGFSFDAPTKVVDLYVHYLRRKLARAGAGDLIQTIRGIGYSIGR